MVFCKAAVDLSRSVMGARSGMSRSLHSSSPAWAILTSSRRLPSESIKGTLITYYEHLARVHLSTDLSKHLFLAFSQAEQGTRLMEAKALRPHARLNFTAAFISYCTTKKIKWLIFLLMWWNPLYGCCAQSFILLQNRKRRGGKIWTSVRNFYCFPQGKAVRQRLILILFLLLG